MQMDRNIGVRSSESPEVVPSFSLLNKCGKKSKGLDEE